jgi:gluconolactonase
MDRATGRVWQVNVETGDTEILAQMDWYPNGIGFGLDPDTLIVADSTNGHIVRYALSGRHLGPGDAFIKLDAGHPDGFDFDTDGNLVLAVPSAGDHGEIQTWSMEGKLLDVFVPGPARLYTNVALNADGVLIVTNSSDGTVIRFDNWPAVGLPLYPFRTAT